jgi:hypothetical protein
LHRRGKGKMNLKAIALSRALAFIETIDLNPNGSVFFPDLCAGMVKNFRFQKFPQTMAEMDETKGIVFEGGTWSGNTILKLTIWNNALVIDTRCSTEETKEILTNALQWAADNFALDYKEGMIKRWRYVTDLIVISEAPLLAVNPAATRLFDSVGKRVSEIIGEPFTYHPSRIVGDFERHPRNVPLAAMDIQRRADTPFSENKYFSEAPLPTEIHYALLEQYERDLLAK